MRAHVARFSSCGGAPLKKLPSGFRVSPGGAFINRIQRRCTTRAEQSGRSEEENLALVEVTKRIRDLGRQGKLKAAVGELAGFARLGFQPDAQAASALLDACVKNRKMEMAESVFQDLFGEIVEPDDVTFCILLRGYGATNPPQWQKIQIWLSRMEADFGVRPTTEVYNTLLEVCSRTKDMEMAEKLVDRMAAEGIQANEFTEGIVSKRRALRGLVRRLDQYIEVEEQSKEDLETPATVL